MVIALDRQEKGQGNLSAIQEVEAEYNIPVISIIGLADIANYLENSGDEAVLDAINQYRKQYGIDQ
jgi:orotate phosphoribosyltransferase